MISMGGWEKRDGIQSVGESRPITRQAAHPRVPFSLGVEGLEEGGAISTKGGLRLTKYEAAGDARGTIQRIRQDGRPITEAWWGNPEAGLNSRVLEDRGACR